MISSTTFLAYTLKHNTFTDYLELFFNIFWDFQVIIGPVMKIENLAALNAMQMMMVCHIWVESLGASKYFDDINDADFCESL